MLLHPQARLGSIVKGMVMLKRRAGEARQKVAGQSRRRIPLTYADTQRHVPLGWPCPRCTYLNVAARQACELCAQPRPANPEPEALAVSQQQELLQGIKLLEQRAAHLDVQQMVMKDDGNCQFRAVAYQLYRDQGYHPQVPPAPGPRTWRVHLDAPGQRHGQQPVSGTADPRSSQTGQVIRGLR